LNEYLTTDQLLKLLKTSVADNHEPKPKKTFKLNKKFIYVSIAVLAVLHLVYMAIPLVFQEKTKDLLGFQYVVAIGQNQAIDTELVGKVYLMKKVDSQSLEVGTHVLVYGLFSSSVYWEVEITAINLDQQTVSATFDGVISNTYQFNDIKGLALRDANVIGIAYYTASTPNGFIYMTLFHVIILGITYYLMFGFEWKKKENI
jgi:hypothetical protein